MSRLGSQESSRRRSRRRSSHRPRPPLLRYGAILVVTLILLWLSVAISVAGFIREIRPDVALRFWPGDGFAEAMQSEMMMQQSVRAPQREQELELARDALAAEPTSARAARLLAMLAPDQAQISRGFAYARSLSRRDLFINLWFIEEAVQRNDVPGALAQYDVTLRTSTEAPRLLFPILSSALTQSDLDPSIARLLATGGEWVPDFFDHVLAEQTRTGDLGRTLLTRPEILGRITPATQARLVAELADARQFETGARIYRLLSGRVPMAAGERAPVAAGAWPPFDWSAVDSGNFGASASPGDSSLQVYAQSGFRGTVARRLVRLDPGAYRLVGSGTVSASDSAGDASWSVTCAERDSPPAANLAIGGQPGRRQAQQAPFRIAPGCSWFWVNLEVGSAQESDRFEAALDGIRIDRLPG